MIRNTAKIFYLKNKVLFPYCSAVVSLKRSDLSSKLGKGEKIIAFPVKFFFDIFFLKRRIATLAEISEIDVQDKKTVLQLRGITRVRIIKSKRFHVADYISVSQNITGNDFQLTKDLRKKAQELIFLINVDESDKLIDLMNYIVDINQISDFIGNYFILDYKHRLDLLNETDAGVRGLRVFNRLHDLIKKIERRRNEEVS